jgi:hypothetical protein
MTSPATHCKIQGQSFKSIWAASKHFKVAPATISLAIDNGRTDFIGAGRNSPVPTEVDGITYPSKRAAQRAQKAVRP